MANFAGSVLLAGQTVFNRSFIANGEWKGVDVSALKVMREAIKVNPSLASVRTSEKRKISGVLPIRQAATNKTERTFDHKGIFGDSKKVDLEWATFAETFSISKKLADNNILVGAEMYNRSMQNAILNITTRIEAWALAQLVADRTQFCLGGANGTFNATSNAFEMEKAQRKLFFANARLMMMKNGYKGNLCALTDTMATSLAQELSFNGSNNADNTAAQLSGFIHCPTFSNVLTGFDASAILVDPSLVGMSSWIPGLNRKAPISEKIESVLGDYYNIYVPELGLELAVHAYTERADTNVSGGDRQDEVTQFEISTDVCYQSSPLSDIRGPRESVVFGIGLKK